MGQGVIADLPRLVEPFCKGGKVGVITDDTVDALYAAKAVWAMEQYGYDVCKYVIPYGESSKNINTLSGILEYFASCHFSVCRSCKTLIQVLIFRLIRLSVTCRL